MSLRILHVLDHSLPLHSGYTFRTLSILREQRRLGWETSHLTGPKQDSADRLEDMVDGWHFFRTPLDNARRSGFPAVARTDADERDLRAGLQAVAEQVRPQLLHAHSPVLNAIPALRVGRRLGVPVALRSPRILGRRRGRSRSNARRGAALSADAQPSRPMRSSVPTP